MSGGPVIQQGFNATNRVASTTDNAVVRFDGTTGLIQNSAFVVDDTGHVTSFGGNIQFPASQAASAGANVLDDYEEGTWTPTITPGSGSITSYTSTGVYTKIGRLVTFQLTFTLTNAGTAGTSLLATLPFTNGSERASFSCREVAIVGYVMGCSAAAAGTTCTMQRYDGTFRGSTNDVFVVSGSYIV